MKIHIILVFASFLLLGACNSSTEKSEFDRQPILINISENLIMPSYQNTLDEIGKLEDLTLIFEQNPTEENLLKMREQWKMLAAVWNHAEVFNFGPIESNFIENSIYYWPIDTSGFQSAMNAYAVQEQYLQTVGSNRKGIAALEYLLFSGEPKASVEKLQRKEAIAFLQLLCKDLNDNLSNLIQQWSGGYQQQFVENSGNSADASLNLLANEMIFLLEKVKNRKLAVPMGKTEGSEPNPQLLEAPYSEYSLSLVKENLKAIQAVFNGGEGKGMDDYLDALDIKNDNNSLLSRQINEQFNQAISSCESIESSLSEAIVTQDMVLDQLYLDVIDLNIMLKNDMMSQLGFVVTFSDNDGD